MISRADHRRGPRGSSHSRPARPLRVGVSACLLGQQVRFDGGHKRDVFVTETLAPFVEWYPVCPEVEAGFGTPREAVRLVGAAGAPRLIGVRTGTDRSQQMHDWTARRLEELASADLCGYVLKKDSPSCGLERVRVYDAHGTAARTGRGLFTAALAARFPWLPLEDEGRLIDPRLRENFITRVFAYRRLRDLFSDEWTVGDLVAFHATHKLMLLAHRPQAYVQLGRLVARAASRSQDDVEAEYIGTFMAALGTIATPGRHANVLLHMLGYFTRELDADTRHELLALVGAYAAERVPLVVPLTMFRHHIRRLGVGYLARQVYLNPHPAELQLHNRV